MNVNPGKNKRDISCVNCGACNRELGDEKRLFHTAMNMILVNKTAGVYQQKNPLVYNQFPKTIFLIEPSVVFFLDHEKNPMFLSVQDFLLAFDLCE
jgi:hypothetical protein